MKKFFFQKKSHSAEKCKRGTLLDLLTNIPFKISKNSKGGPFGDIKKFSKKSRTVPKKIQRGDPLGTSGFVCFLEKVKNERGTLWSKVCLGRTWPLGLRCSAQNCKKWTDQCEDCSLKKKVTAIVGHFSLKGKRAD